MVKRQRTCGSLPVCDAAKARDLTFVIQEPDPHTIKIVYHGTAPTPSVGKFSLNVCITDHPAGYRCRQCSVGTQWYF
jgi:hypothetical protein